MFFFSAIAAEMCGLSCGAFSFTTEISFLNWEHYLVVV